MPITTEEQLTALTRYAELSISLNELLKTEAIVYRCGRYMSTMPDKCAPVSFRAIVAATDRLSGSPAAVAEYCDVLQLPCFDVSIEGRDWLAREQAKAVRSRQ